MAEISEAETAEIIAENELLLDVLIVGYRKCWAYEAGAHIDLAGNVIWPDQPEHPDNRGGTDG